MSPSPARLLAALSLAAVLLRVASACSSDSPTTPGADGRVQRVVLVTIDGLRADALDSMPTLGTLRHAGAWTDEARSVLPALTLPAHLSLLTGRDVTTLGIRDNALDASRALDLMLAGATPVFRWIDGPSDAVIGASLLPAQDLELARTYFGLRHLVATGLDDDAIIDAALARAGAGDPPRLLFVHLPEVDLAGHEHGWITAADAGSPGALGAAYLAAVRGADAAVGRLYASLASEIAAGRVAMIITADHGGGHGLGCVNGIPPAREHCTAHAGDQSVPLVILARDVAPGRLAGVVPITRVAATVASLLGAATPAGAAASLVE